MSSLTATVDSKLAQVRLDIDVSDVAPVPTLTITRTRLDTGVSSTVRPYGVLSGGLIQPVGGVIVVYDTEAPLDVAVQYTASYNSGSGLVQLNANPGAENGLLTPWAAATAGALAVSQTQAQGGYWSFRFTPDGVTANPAWQSEEVPAVVGKSYTVAGQLWSTSAFTWSVGIRWYDNTHTPLSISTFNVALGAGAWTAYSNSATAPANAAFARIFVQASGTPAGANILYGDQLTISTTISVSVTSANVTVPSNGFGWLRDPARPANSLQLDMTRRPSSAGVGGNTPGAVLRGVGYLGLGAQTRRFMGSVHDVSNSPYPVSVARARRAPGFDIRLAPRSFADRDAVHALVQPGSALMLQLPAVYGEPDRYVAIGDVATTPVLNDQRKQVRTVGLPATEQLAPPDPSAGAIGERFSDLDNHFATWGALAAGTTGLYDTYTRTVGAGSLGTPDVSPGGAGYTLSGTAAHFSVNGSAAVIGLATIATPDRALLGSLAALEAYLTVTPPVVATGAPYRVAVEIRTVDASNYYTLGVAFGLAGATTVFVSKLVAGVETVIASAAGPTYSAAQPWSLHVLASGTRLAATAWVASTVEPVAYTVDTIDSAFAAAGSYGLYARLDTGNTNATPVNVQLDDFQVLAGPTWQAIMDGAVA